MSLPRELLKWIQGLDLTFSIRNPIRDLANGFTVAEIISRYFPDDISLHSYDTGISLHVRVDNWNQISKVLRRHDISPISDVLIDEVIHHQGVAAIEMLGLLYTALTEGAAPLIPTVQSAIPPSYARATAAFTVKDPVIDRTVDMIERRMKAAEAIVLHEEEARQTRPVVQSSLPKSNGRSQTPKLITTSDSVQSVQVKKIEVKALGRVPSTQSPLTQPVTTGDASSHDDSTVPPIPVPPTRNSVLAVLSQTIPVHRRSESSLPTDPYWPIRVAESMTGEELLVAIASLGTDHLPLLMKAILESPPNEFYILVKFVEASLRTGIVSPEILTQAFQLLAAVGNAIRAHSEILALCLVRDYVVPSICRMDDSVKANLMAMLRSEWISENNQHAFTECVAREMMFVRKTTESA